MKVPIPINQKYALQMQNIKKRVCASRSALICLIITILTLMQYLYGTNMNFTQLTIYTKLENKTVWIDQSLDTIVDTMEPELHVISYRSWNKCSKYAKKKGKSCDTILKNICNCIRLNAQVNISINYLGDNEEKEYIPFHLDKIVENYKYLEYLSKLYSIQQQKESIIIMFVDAFDTVFQRNKSVILQQFLEIAAKVENKGKVIWQVEGNCWPPFILDCDRFPKQPQGADAKYLNAGVWIGFLYDVLNNFKEFIAFIDKTDGRKPGKPNEYWGDQDVIGITYINRSIHMTLDYFSVISQAMNKKHQIMELKQFGLYNKDMKHYPSLLHFNGNKQIIDQYLSQLAGIYDRPRVPGDYPIRLTNVNVSRYVKYNEMCSRFNNWYY